MAEKKALAVENEKLKKRGVRLEEEDSDVVVEHSISSFRGASCVGNEQLRIHEGKNDIPMVQFILCILLSIVVSDAITEVIA